jgi:hypothetical protein
MVAHSIRKRQLGVVGALICTVLVVLLSLLLVQIRKQDAPVNICRVTAIEVLLADQLGNLVDGQGSFECEIVVQSAMSSADNNIDNATTVNGEDYLNVKFASPEIVRANALALENDEWFIQFQPEWIVPDTRTLVFPTDEAVHTVSPIRMERNRKLTTKSAIDNARRDEQKLRPRRRLVPVEAAGKVIIVRVTMADRSVMYTADELYSFVFAPTNSLWSQMNDCSHGALNMQPYDPDEPVLELSVQYGVDDYNFDSLFREANPMVKDLYNGMTLGDIVEHVMYVVPTGLGGGSDGSTGRELEAVSAAAINQFKALYTDKWFAQVGVLLHQTAHNKGLGHAWEGDDQFGDSTGAMGRGEPGVERVCFNGLQTNNLGWMSDRTVAVDAQAEEGQRVELISYVDYAAAVDDQAVILIVGPYFLTYNLKKGFNSETMEKENQVLIVQRESRVPDSVATNLVGSLDANKNLYFVREAFFSSGESLVIEVCEIQSGVPSFTDSITVAVGTSPTPCTAMPSAMPSVSVAPSPAPVKDSSGLFPLYDKESTHFQNIDALACEDSLDVKFYMNSTLGRQRCSWLRQNLSRPHNETTTVKDAFCTKSHDAFHFCEETCGACTDSCDDDAGAVFMLAGAETTCYWLSGRPFLWTLACKHEEIALACQESCESC